MTRLKTIELYSLNVQIGWYVDYIAVKLLKKNVTSFDSFKRNNKSPWEIAGVL